MISVYSVALTLVIAASVVILLLFNRLAAKLNYVEECRRALEAPVRQRLDFICDKLETCEEEAPHSEALMQLKDMCESVRDVETNVMLSSHKGVEAMLRPVKDYFLQSEVFMALEEQILATGHQYNEAATVYNREISAFPGTAMAKVFLLPREPLFEMPETFT